MLSLRRRYGVQYVPLHGASTIRTLLQQLRARRIVLITADRVVQGSSVEVSFFNAKERLPWGPVALALRSGTPFIGAFGWYDRDQHIYGALVSITLRLLEERRSDPEAVILNTASGSSCVSSKNANARSGVM
jgi:lauroyl/myristoyl acyltransferase